MKTKNGYFEKPTYNGGVEIGIFRRAIPHPEAEFAMALIERWGQVQGVSDGEDTAGRAKLRLATPQEVVDRACAVATLAFAEFIARDWMLELPEPIAGNKEDLAAEVFSIRERARARKDAASDKPLEPPTE